MIVALFTVPARGNAAPPGSRETLNLVMLLGVSSTALTTKYVVFVFTPVILPTLPNVIASPSSSSPSVTSITSVTSTICCIAIVLLFCGTLPIK